MPGRLPDLQNVERLLIIRLSAIGDVIHALPLASALKDTYPKLQISWLVEEIPADVVLGNPDLTQVIVVPRSRWKRGRGKSPQVWREYLALLRRIRDCNFDVTIDLQGYAKSAVYALASGAKYRIGWWRMRDGAGLVSQAIMRLPSSVHRVDWFLDVARRLGIENPRVRFPIDIPEEAQSRVAAWLADAGIGAGRPFVVVNQAAGNPPRRWGMANYAALAVEIAAEYGMASVWIGTKPEEADCAEIVRRVSAELSKRGVAGIPKPLNLAGKTSLKDLAALLELCTFHVCGDTGSTHLAAALGVPVVAFYGSTDPAHAGPWNQLHNVLAHREMCSPKCTIRRCAYADPECVRNIATTPTGESLLYPTARCLRAISVSDAMAVIREMLGRENA